MIFMESGITPSCHKNNFAYFIIVSVLSMVSLELLINMVSLELPRN